MKNSIAAVLLGCSAVAASAQVTQTQPGSQDAYGQEIAERHRHAAEMRRQHHEERHEQEERHGMAETPQSTIGNVSPNMQPQQRFDRRHP